MDYSPSQSLYFFVCGDTAPGSTLLPGGRGAAPTFLTVMMYPHVTVLSTGHRPKHTWGEGIELRS